MELVGYAQPCVAYPGGTVDVKVSSTLPEFTAEVVRLGLQTEPADPRGRRPAFFPAGTRDSASGSFLVADLSSRRPRPGRRRRCGSAPARWVDPSA